MLEYLKHEANMTVTENGAATYASTGSDCLDFFATVGALRHANDREIISRFTRAYAEDPDIAMKLLFYARDIRGGLGERRVFRVILRRLAYTAPGSVIKNLRSVEEYGRFDDLLSLMNTPCEKEMLTVIRDQFESDMKALKEHKPVSLLGKWLPSVNASSAATRLSGKKIARALGLTEAAYRKSLTALRAEIQIIENNLREGDYSFDYGKQPSRAMFKYKKAFIRNDRERYRLFLEAVNAGGAVLHADNVAPYELAESLLTHGSRFIESYCMKHISEEEKLSLNAAWNSLTDFGGTENALAVIDTSGSMYRCSVPLPAAIALSLGLYFAERNKGAFRNHFIEFSDCPQLIEIKGETFIDRLSYLASFNRIANTNLQAVFDLILSAAVKNNVPQEELPAKLVIISDMEFDACVDNATATNFETARNKFKAFGYKLPEIIFWNVASKHSQQPVTRNEQGVALVSGVTPRLFSMIAGGILSPYAFMMEVLESDRYASIAA